MKLYSVLLLIPDYHAADFGSDVYYDCVEAPSVTQAVSLVRQAYMADQLAEDGSNFIQDEADLFVLLVTEGRHADLSAEVNHLVPCQVCDATTAIGVAHKHQDGWVCEACWDERLRTTA